MSQEDKVDELRDTFERVTGGTEVREERVERGTLKTEAEVREGVHQVVTDVVETYGSPADLETDELVEVVTSFFDGDSDGEIADDLDVAAEDVRRARLDLCLTRESEDDPEASRRDDEGGYSLRLESLFPESDLSRRITEGVEDDGLDEATADQEVDTQV